MRVSGVDRSAMGIEVARRRLPEARFELADIQDSLPFEDRAFDIAFARGLSHLGSPELSTDANRRALENVMRLVRPGGILLTSTYTTRTGAPSETSAWMNHTSSSIVALLAEVGEPVRLDLVGNYLQVAAGHRGAPWPRPAV
jgi:SAM-dependent methyltransferase